MGIELRKQMKEFQYSYNYLDLMNRTVQVIQRLVKVNSKQWQMQQQIRTGDTIEQKSYTISESEAKYNFKFATEYNGKSQAFQSANWYNIQLEYVK